MSTICDHGHCTAKARQPSRCVKSPWHLGETSSSREGLSIGSLKSLVIWLSNATFAAPTHDALNTGLTGTSRPVSKRFFGSGYEKIPKVQFNPADYTPKIDVLRQKAVGGGDIATIVIFLSEFNTFLGSKGLKKSDVSHLRGLQSADMNISKKVDYIIYYWGELSRRQTIEVDNWEELPNFSKKYNKIIGQIDIIKDLPKLDADGIGQFTKAGVASDVDTIEKMFYLNRPFTRMSSSLQSSCNVADGERAQAASMLSDVLKQFNKYSLEKTPRSALTLSAHWKAMSDRLHFLVDPKGVDLVRNLRHNAMRRSLFTISYWESKCKP